MRLNAEKLKIIVDEGHQMAHAGHFDSAGILKAVETFDKRHVAKVGFLFEFLFEQFILTECTMRRCL